jgi:hypothetical protein
MLLHIRSSLTYAGATFYTAKVRFQKPRVAVNDREWERSRPGFREHVRGRISATHIELHFWKTTPVHRRIWTMTGQILMEEEREDVLRKAQRS